METINATLLENNKTEDDKKYSFVCVRSTYVDTYVTIDNFSGVTAISSASSNGSTPTFSAALKAIRRFSSLFLFCPDKTTFVNQRNTITTVFV
jgi:hypothetical protein